MGSVLEEQESQKLAETFEVIFIKRIRHLPGRRSGWFKAVP
jgi:hypothetical protein